MGIFLVGSHLKKELKRVMANVWGFYLPLSPSNAFKCCIISKTGNFHRSLRSFIMLLVSEAVWRKMSAIFDDIICSVLCVNSEIGGKNEVTLTKKKSQDIMPLRFYAKT